MSYGPGPWRRLVVAVSGSGRTLENFISETARSKSYELVGVIASRPDCRGVEIARQHGLPLLVRHFSRQDHSLADEVYAWLAQQQAGLVALGGFLRPFPIAPEFHGRVINIHPALLPRFGGQGMYGDRVHEAVLRAGESVSGATVHEVTANYDEGRILDQIKVPVLVGDTVRSLAQRVFAAECQLYPQVVERLVLQAGMVH